MPAPAVHFVAAAHYSWDESQQGFAVHMGLGRSVRAEVALALEQVYESHTETSMAARLSMRGKSPMARQQVASTASS